MPFFVSSMTDPTCFVFDVSHTQIFFNMWYWVGWVAKEKKEDNGAIIARLLGQLTPFWFTKSDDKVHTDWNLAMSVKV